MAFLLVTLLVVLYSFQSLFLKLFSAKYPAEKSALASTVFNISYGAFAGITTLCAMGFRFSASKVTDVRLSAPSASFSVMENRSPSFQYRFSRSM